MYKHYIRLNENKEIIEAFCDTFEKPLKDDILYLDTEDSKAMINHIEPRHTHLCCPELFPIFDIDGNYAHKYVDGKVIKNNQL